MRTNPFSIVDAPAWLSLSEIPDTLDAPDVPDTSKTSSVSAASEGPTEQLFHELTRLARLVDRLREVAEYAPGLYETLPWLRDVSVWDLVLRRRANTCFPNLPSHWEFRETPGALPNPGYVTASQASEPTTSPRSQRPPGSSVAPRTSATAATLLSFFTGVTQPVAEMIESLYVSRWPLDPINVWDILRRMARAAGVRPLPRNVVTGVCANLVRERVDAMGRDRSRPRLSVWKITWRPISVRLRWPQRPLSLQGAHHLHWSEEWHNPHQSQAQLESCGPSKNERSMTSILVVVTEEVACKPGGRYKPSGKILAFRCFPGELDLPRRSSLESPANLGSPDTDSKGRNNKNTDENVGSIAEIARHQAFSQALETAVKLALYDALIFPLTARGELRRHISPPILLRVESPMPTAIRQAAQVWRIKLEEVMEYAQDAERSRHCMHSKCSVDPPHESDWEREQGWEQEQEQEQEGEQGSEWETEREEELELEREFDWRWESELTNRVLYPVHYLRILDRACERAYGYAPFLAKQRAVHQLGWRWHMFPQDDPLQYYPGLPELLPSFPATVGEDGTVEWQGRHYRDYDNDLLRYLPHTRVTVRPSPLAEAAILVYWKGVVLCYAVAEELRHEDGSFRAYWFPYPRLGE